MLLNRFVLSNCMLRLDRRQSVWLSCTDGCFKCKNVLFEEALEDKFFYVPLGTSAMDELMSLAFVEGTILFCSGECGVALDWFRVSYP